MGVERRHQEYMRLAPMWRKDRDVLHGSSRVRPGREIYLPRLGGHSKTVQGHALYQAYWKGGYFAPFAGRTRHGLVGLATRNPPVVSYKAPKIEAWLKNMTGRGMGLAELRKRLIYEVLSTGRAGLLTDYGSPVDTSATVLEAGSDPRRRPFTRLFEAENILNWGSWWNDDTEYPWIVLQETVLTPDEQDAFFFSQQREYLVLALDPSQGGAYYQQRWRSPANRAAPVPVVTRETDDSGKFYPLRQDQRMKFIPFRFIGVYDNTPQPDEPPMDGLCDIALQYYIRRTSKNNALNLAENPTFTIAGEIVSKTGATGVLEVGAGAVLHLKEGGTASYVGLEGSLDASDSELDRLIREAVAEGARMLETEKKAAEAAETHELRRQGEISILASILGNVCAALTDTLRWFCWLDGVEDDPEVKTDQALAAPSMTAAEALSWVEVWMKGGIARADLHLKLAEGGGLAPGRTLDDVLKELLAESGTRMQAAGVQAQLAALQLLVGMGVKRNVARLIVGLEILPNDPEGDIALVQNIYETFDTVVSGGAGAAGEGLAAGMPRKAPGAPASEPGAPPSPATGKA